MSSSPEVSVVLCTWNRATLLEGALATLVTQDAAPAHEIVVVDNNSTDDTRRVVERHAARHAHVRYVFEATAGLSHARNTGIAHTTGAMVAFTDDDVRVPRDWLRVMTVLAQQHPDAACLGGPVLPEWAGEAPAWLTENQWSALGVQDYGNQPFRVDEARPVCLIGANLVLRRSALDATGPFDPSVQRVGNRVGSTEDHDYHRRLWAAGAHGIYDPRLRVVAVVTPERLTRRYHRRWHFGHGQHIARMRIADMERAGFRLFGVPAHLLRQACAEALLMMRRHLARDRAGAFQHELRIWFAAGFIHERVRTGRSPRVNPGERD